MNEAEREIMYIKDNVEMLVEVMEEVETSLRKIDRLHAFICALGCIIDCWQAENEISDDEMQKNLEGLLGVRKLVRGVLGPWRSEPADTDMEEL